MVTNKRKLSEGHVSFKLTEEEKSALESTELSSYLDQLPLELQPLREMLQTARQLHEGSSRKSVKLSTGSFCRITRQG